MTLPIPSKMDWQKYTSKASLSGLIKQGEILFDHPYVEILRVDGKGQFMVSTASGKWGTVDLQGNLVVDTLFSAMSSFEQGVFIVESLDPYYLSRL